MENQNPTEATQQTNNNCCNCNNKKNGGFLKGAVKVIKYVGIGIGLVATGIAAERKLNVYDRAKGRLKKAHEQKGGENR